MKEYEQTKKESENTWTTALIGTETAQSPSPIKTYMITCIAVPHIQDHQKKKKIHQSYQKHQWTITLIIHQTLIKINITSIQVQDQNISNSYHVHQRYILTPTQMAYKTTTDDPYTGQ
jgi:hypothetical protein